MWTIYIFAVQRWFTLSIEPPSQVVSFTELSNQAQVTAGRWGKVSSKSMWTANFRHI